MSDQSCNRTIMPAVMLIPGNLNKTGDDFKTALCVTMDRCSKLVDQEEAPETHIIPCGFDTKKNQIMICCLDELVEQESTIEAPAPWFSSNQNLEARECEDRSELCEKWKQNGGCQLDRDITIRGRCENNKLAKLRKSGTFRKNTLGINTLGKNIFLAEVFLDYLLNFFRWSF